MSRAEWLWLTSGAGRARGADCGGVELLLGCEVLPELGCCVVGPGLGGGGAGAGLGVWVADPGLGNCAVGLGLGGRGLDPETGCWELESELCCWGVDSELACWEVEPRCLVSDFFLLPFFMVDPPDLSVYLHGAA